MGIIKLIDPFLMQLVIVPLIVIATGVWVSIRTKKVWISPIVTLILNVMYEIWYMKYYYPDKVFSFESYFTSWNIIFPTISLIIALFLVLPKLNLSR